MFIFILFLVVALMQFYVFWRAASIPRVSHHFSRRSLWILAVTLWGLLVLSRVVSPEMMGGGAIVFLGMTWLGLLFLMFSALLAVEVVTGLGWFFGRFASRLRGWALVMSGVLAVVAFVQGTRAPVVQPYDVYLAELPRELDGMVMVALTDMHLGVPLDVPWLAARVTQVQAEHPDLIVLVGDIFEGRYPPSQAMLTTMRQFSAPMGTWAVLGNHESYGDHPEHTALFNAAGAHLLRNTWTELRPGLILAGVDNVANQQEAETFVAQALKGRSAGGATLLLCHEPFLASPPVRKGVNLMVSGHTHGGQLWPFGYLVQQRFPLFTGLYALEDLTVIVSRGTGTWGPRMRLWQPAEILRITLHRDHHANVPSNHANPVD
jgi:predicted MPP superfamily phosphohydrolase